MKDSKKHIPIHFRSGDHAAFTYKTPHKSVYQQNQLLLVILSEFIISKEEFVLLCISQFLVISLAFLL